MYVKEMLVISLKKERNKTKMPSSLYLFNIVPEEPAISTVRKDDKKDKYMKERNKNVPFYQ